MTTAALEKAADMTRQALADLAAQSRAAVMKSAMAFTTEHPDVVMWIGENMGTSEFAASLARQFDERGTLSQKQIEAVRSGAARSKAAAPAAAIDVAQIVAAFDRAMGRGIQKPTMRLDSFRFKSAGEEGRNAGAIYVTEEGQYLGKIMGGRFLRSAECTPDQEGRIVTAASNPEQAAEAYGRRTGCCSICGLKLTAAESIARTIGPICYDKYF